MKRSRYSHTSRQWIYLLSLCTALPGILLAVLLFMQFGSAQAAGNLTVSIMSAPNLVVDSNITSPATAGPSVATVAGVFCNTGDSVVTDVMGYIGDYTGSFSTSTPGVYPSRFHPPLEGEYSLTHLGGTLGAGDATRYVGDLAPGECKVQYWHLTYPRCENNQTPPCSGDPVWLSPNTPDDDLWLEFDVWGVTREGTVNFATQTVNMRNEISAMANKIEPNPDGAWFNTESNSVRPGELITSNGVNYELGLVNQGFDNDGDFIPDYNAWLQPIGDMTFDPACFRLLRTSGVLTVTRGSGNPDMVIPFEDQLYFTDLPADNTGVRGRVYYTFLALNGPCDVSLAPYQEVASGFDNEKFNSDYGTGLPGFHSYEPALTLDKASSPNSIPAGGTITYNMYFANTAANASIGMPSMNAPLVIQDSIPAGTVFNGSASFLNCSSLPGTILYSTNAGNTWSSVMPPANTVTTIRWLLNAPLGPNQSCQATFQVTVPSSYMGSPFIENTACARLGDGPNMLCDTTVTIVEGTNSIGDLVWQDDNSNGTPDIGEPGLVGVGVTLYWDKNGNSLLDDGDVAILSQDSTTNGYYMFSNLPNGNFLVAVDELDPAIPVGYNYTTRIVYPVFGLGTTITSPYLAADFGFGPTLLLDKVLVPPGPVNEGDLVSYDIHLTNTRPASSGGLCTHYVWAGALDPNQNGSGVAAWINEANALGSGGPNGSFAYSNFSNNLNHLSATAWDFTSSVYGQITSVEAVYSIYATGTFQPTTPDYARGFVWYNNVQVGATRTFTSADLLPYIGSMNQRLLVWDITGSRTWSWSDFNNNALALELETTKDGQLDGVVIYMDALGFRVTTDQPCGGAGDDIAILPLTDTYDSNRLQFVSADPAPDSTTPPGTLSWDNLGPLYGGETTTVHVTFLALDPGAASVTTDNTAHVAGAKFGNGRPINEATDIEPVTILRTNKIGDFIWWNKNGDNVQDPGEPGLPGVVVRLCSDAACNTVLQTTTTDASGHYEFTAVDGNYFVRVTPPAYSTPNSDPDGTLDNVAPAIVAGNDLLDRDFGYNLTRSIVYGKVWEDNNGDTIQQMGENGFANVTVYLCNEINCTGGGDTSVPTDADGNYNFTGVLPGTYYIRVGTAGMPPGGPWSMTVDPDTLKDGYHQITIATPDIYGSYDFAYRRTPALSEIGDTIFVDWDGDAIQDPGDEGLSGVGITLYEDANGNGIYDPATDAVIATQTTDPTGHYLFTLVPAGNYLVAVDPNTLPDGYLQTLDPDQNGVCSLCDNKDPISVDGTSFYHNEDFAYQPRGGGAIGDRVWEDLNGDGIQGGNELGIPGITVNLYEDTNANGIIDANDALVATTSTGVDGAYIFNNLAFGRYLVDVDTTDPQLPVGSYSQPYLLSTNNDPLLVVLSATQISYLDADFGFMPPAAIGDTIWQDNDADGTQDASEPGLSGVAVQLWRDTNGDSIPDSLYASTTTNADGLYQFIGLPQGDYEVRVTSPSGYFQTGDPDATPVCDPACDDKGEVYNISATLYGLNPGQIDRSLDFGYRPTYYLGDFVWLDIDGDGLQDITELGIDGVTVTLLDSVDGIFGNGDDVIYTTVTDADGYYSFGGLVNRPYRILVSPPVGMVETAEYDGSLDGQVQVDMATLLSSEYMKMDFGFRYNGSYSISGTAWHDTDGDTTIDVEEPVRYAGVTVYLFNGSGELIATTTTDIYGNYIFGTLPPGTYTVAINRDAPNLEGLISTTPLPDNYYTVTLVNSPSENNNFGFRSTLDFGDLPSSYNLTLLNNDGARHNVPATGRVYLGTSIDTEANGATSDLADADDMAGSDDEDGVGPTPSVAWAMGDNGGHLDIVVSGCTGTCYVNVWINWDQDTDFSEPNEHVLIDREVVNGLNGNVLINVPVNPNNQTFYMRTRLYTTSTGGFATPNGLVMNGEVEDHTLSFSPTAVELVTLEAAPQKNDLTPYVILLGSVALLSLGLLTARKARQKRI